MSLSTIADATNAVNRLTDVFAAETFGETQIHNHNIEEALVVENASFSWDAPPQEEEAKGKRPAKLPAKTEPTKGKPEPAEQGTDPEKEEPVFQVKDISMSILRGQLVAIVGSTGSGKTLSSSRLSA